MIPEPYLTPTDDESAALRLHLSQWDELDEWPKSVSVAILRGHRTSSQIALKLGASAEQVEAALTQLLGRGVVSDGGKLMLK